MRDPITGFDYPALWVEKCQQPELLDMVETGLAVLTSSGTVLKRGFTTGTTAAAACKAAILSLNEDISAVTLVIPCGLTVNVPVKGMNGYGSCKKYAGDYPSDVTAGIEFAAQAVPAANGTQLIPGAGIGIFSRDTPRYKKGTPAISAAPLSCILLAIDEALAITGLPGVTVTLTIPLGKKIAKHTLNSRVGVEGGISVLGTTGLVEPWDDHLEESIRERVATGKPVVISTGRVGLRYARMLFPDHEVVLVGGRIGEALDAASGEVILCGLPALILKFIDPHILDGTGYATVEELSVSPVFDPVVQPVLLKFSKNHPRVRVVLVNREGMIIGESP